ncbi:hypothetical protein AAMO2058_000537600 [Amorphochlora amoebiformis]
MGGVVASRGPREINGVVIREHERFPKQLIHEYCQRQKRPKPRYQRCRCDVKDMFRSRIVLPDSKNESKDIVFEPQEPRSSLHESDQYAALLALHHVSPTLPLHKRMPQPYALAWKSMGSKESQVTTERKFISKQQKNLHHKKKREIANKREAKKLQAQSRYMTVHMSEDVRRIVENVLKSSTRSKNTLSPSEDASQILSESKDAMSVYKVLTKMGFSPSDAKLGVTTTFVGEGKPVKSLVQGALDWLCLHLPEHRLPRYLDASNNTFAVAYIPDTLKEDPKKLNTKGTPKEKRVSYMASRLAKQGYPMHRCREIAVELVKSSSVETDIIGLYLKALSILISEMMQNHPKFTPSSLIGDSEEIEMEAEGLSAILSQDFVREKGYGEGKGEIWKIRIKPDEIEKPKKLSPGIKRLWEYEGWWYLYISSTTTYPHSLPPMWYTHSGLSAQQNLLIIYGISKLWHDNEMTGTPMVYEILEHLKANMPNMLQENLPVTKSWLVDTEIKVVKSDEKVSRGRQSRKKGFSRDKTEDIKLKENLDARNSRKDYQKMKGYRENLPAFKEKQRIVKTLNESRVLVISGETGCGKSTQIPQFLLDHMIDSNKGSIANIYCTQPRRISAVGLARRVAEERAERAGETVGYRIRLENKVSRRTRLIYMTNGILLRQLSGGSLLEDVSHVVVDEVHERSVDIDMLLLVLRSILVKNRKLKIILMSATVDASTFQGYFDNCPLINIPGRTFPVTSYFLTEALTHSGYHTPSSRQMRFKDQQAAEDRVESLWRLLPGNTRDFPKRCLETAALTEDSERHTCDLDLIEALVWAILTKKTPPLPKTEDAKNPNAGGILIFLPGSYEINQLVSRLQRSSNSRPGFQSGTPADRRKSTENTTIWPLGLHSALPISQQEWVFAKTPKNTVKVVCSTNIAETSITVTDITYVIDSGKVKEMRYDPLRKMQMLVETWASRASGTQRAGRAGRVARGVCYRLLSRLSWQALSSHQEPEIRRTSLDFLILQLKLFPLPNSGGTPNPRGKSNPGANPTRKSDKVSKSLHAEIALGMAIQPPSVEGIRSSVAFLRKVGAIEEGKEENLTPLGRHLARLPVGNVQIGKMVLLSAIFGCVTPIVNIAAMLSLKSPFLSPSDKREQANAARDRFSRGKSDHLTLYAVAQAFASVEEKGTHASKKFCERNFLSYSTLRLVKPTVGQYLQSLADAGFLPGAKPFALRNGASVPKAFDINASRDRLLTSVICAGLYPNILQVKAPKHMVKTAHGAALTENEAKELKYYTKSLGRAFLHPCSINFTQHSYESVWLVYSQIVETSKLYVRESTQVTPYALLMFGDPPEINVQSKAISVDKWIHFTAPGRIAVLVRALRKELSLLLETKIQHPKTDIAGSPVVKAILRLLITNGY